MSLILIHKYRKQTRMEQFDVVSKIGQGAFASVYKVKRKDDGNIYALKKMKAFNVDTKDISNCLNEIRILASISNPYIIGYKQAFYEEKHRCFCLVTEYAQDGDLLNLINQKKKRKQHFHESEIWKVAIQALHGLKYLHAMNVFHRDIKSANILLAKNFTEVKLADLNVSVISKTGLAKTQAGTPYYASPEVWSEKPYNYKSDIWSLGCVLFQMATFRPPFIADNLQALKRKIIIGNTDRIPLIYSEQLQAFIKKCLILNPNDRPSASSLLTYKIIKQYSEKLCFQPQNIDVENQDPNPKLLKTILPPINRNFSSLKEKFPKSKYNNKNEKQKRLASLENRSDVNCQNSALSRDGSKDKLPSMQRIKSMDKKNMAVYEQLPHIPRQHKAVRMR